MRDRARFAAHVAPTPSSPRRGEAPASKGRRPPDGVGEFRVCGDRSPCHDEPLMRTHRVPIVTVMALCAVGLVACGLDTQGRLVADSGPTDVTTSTASDGSSVAPGDDDATVDPGGDDAATSDDAAPIAHRDGSAPVASDSGRPVDAAPDAPFTCSGCAAQMCPTQLAACGKGSDCLAYRDCAEGCSGMNSSTCSSQCESMHSAGEAAFGALTLCDFGCGGACVAGLAIGTP